MGLFEVKSMEAAETADGRNGVKVMDFLNAFLSYGLVLLCFIVAGGLAIFLGITLRKNKNKQEELCQNQQDKN